MIHASRNSGRAACAAALVALVATSACSQAPKRGSGAGPAYKIGAVGARLSASAGDPSAMRQARTTGEARSSRPAAKPGATAQGRTAQGRTASASATPARSAGTAARSSSPGTVIVPTQVAAPQVQPAPSAMAAAAQPPAREAPVRLDRVAMDGVRAVPAAARELTTAASNAAPWSWIAAILAGFAAALALAWVLRPRASSPSTREAYATPTPANDRGDPGRTARRAPPAPPKVTILAGARAR